MPNSIYFIMGVKKKLGKNKFNDLVGIKYLEVIFY